MKSRTTVQLFTRDPKLFRKTSVALAAADYHVLSDASGDNSHPDLILRHWADTDWRSHPDPVPVLTLDLGIVSDEDLVRVVERVLGHRGAGPGTRRALGQLLMENGSAASGYARSRWDRRTQN